MDKQDLFQKWLEKECDSHYTDKPVWDPSHRSYRHIDSKINPLKRIDQLQKELLSTKFISRKAFYPFLHYDIETPRYKKKLDGTREMTVKVRSIKYAAHYDALIYSWYATLIDCFYEQYLITDGATIASSVIAYRSFHDAKCNINFAYEAFTKIASFDDKVTVIAVDVSGFFDNLDHTILFNMVTSILPNAEYGPDYENVLKSITKFSYISTKKFNALLKASNIQIGKYRLCTPSIFRKILKNNDDLPKVNKEGKGIPQGSPISAVLANVYMITVDQELSSYSKANNGIYRRYSDDILLAVPNGNKEMMIGEVQKVLKKNKLDFNDDKTEEFYFQKDESEQFKCYDADKGTLSILQYLGFEYNGQDIRLRSSTLSKFYRRMKQSILAELIRQKELKYKQPKVKKLRYRFTHLGLSRAKRLNFLSYAYRAAEMMKSKVIMKQLANHARIFEESLAESRKRTGF